ncbi:PhzF family phenazine biosynthesis protein [Streptomyces sp. B6B3]|uniref:PhzF family phenazine biosynthesis protein n=1 Tax=Streptomyces sp. B6B3 TaxID=3153570 RepID=UPI00325E9C9E
MDYSYYLADVFTQRPFGGNQLAVFPDARGLSTADMQALTREFNFSETTFVLPAEDTRHDPRGTRRVRIFTPAMELPFAGHPTVGTAAVLATREGVGDANGELVLEEGVGPVAVRVDGTFARFTVTAPYESADHEPPAPEIAAALSLSASDLVECWYGGVALRYCFVRLPDAATVDRVVLDRGAWSAGVAGGWSPHLYVFAGDVRDGGRLHARAFVPEIGVGEDPATGSACAGLVAGLALRGTAEPGGTAEEKGQDEAEFSVTVHQGVAMGRPSEIEATAYIRDGSLTGVSIGGHTVILGGGTLDVPTNS